MTTTPIITENDLAWDYLNNLGTFSIPEDLSEIDATWVYYMLDDCGEPEVEEAVEALGWADLVSLASDLRDAWHTARCEAMEWERNRPHDYE
jgi:hypothetical protein